MLTFFSDGEFIFNLVALRLEQQVILRRKKYRQIDRQTDRQTDRYIDQIWFIY